MTLLQLLFTNGELTVFLGIIFIVALWAVERVVTTLINTPLELEKERTQQLTLQLELEKTRQGKPKQASIAEYDYEQGYQQQLMEQKQ